MTRSRRLVPFLLVALMAASGVPSWAGGNASFVLGARHMSDDGTWEGDDVDIDLRDQGALGVTIDFGPDDWPVHIDLGLHGSLADDDTTASGTIRIGGQVLSASLGLDVESELLEFNAGVSKTWLVGDSMRPFVGGGLAFVDAEIHFDIDARAGSVTASTSDSLEDNSLGLWVRGGVFWRLGQAFNLGVEGRYLGFTEFEDAGDIFALESGDADYLQVAVLLGWGWSD